MAVWPEEISDEARRRLDHYMEERRLDLGLSWRDVAANANVSYEALRSLRKGPGGIRALTARNIDRALRWRPGSVERTLAGGEPEESGLTGEQQAVLNGAEQILGDALREPHKGANGA